MKSLYLECNAGISGDMLVAALLDLGADKEALAAALDSIKAKGFTYNISRVNKSGVDCCDFDVILDAEHENHDHDMAFLHGSGDAVLHSHDHEHIHGHDHEHKDFDLEEHVHEHCCGHHHHHHEHEHDHGADHEHEHCHEHDHEHEHVHEHCCGHHHHHDPAVPHEHHHAHEHRGLKEVIEIINEVKMSDKARATALKIFDIIAEAEGKAHAVPKDEVHFHEVGAIDSIVDIVAIAVCLDSLQPEQVIVPELCEGRGTVRCQHGVLPVPVPATANIMQAYGLKVRLLPVQGEFVTPTGAAAVAAISTSDQLPERFTILGIGLGAGKRTYERPSILRAMLIEDDPTAQKKNSNLTTPDVIVKLETDLDDCTGEVLGYTLERLLEAGALDAHYLPVFMKKNRPAWQLQVICRLQDVERLEQLIFAETTTIGIRRSVMERTVLPRQKAELQTEYGPVQVKLCGAAGQERCYVEYDSAAQIARAQGVPLQRVYAATIKSQKNIQ